jgi:hypothetical protein
LQKRILKREGIMSYRKFLAFFLGAFFILVFHTSCSNEKGAKTDNLYEKVLKEKEKTNKTGQQEGAHDTEREEQTAIADACSEKYNSCLEKCADSPCENKCLAALTSCEKDLPADLKTIK